jgi:hypothetical protein
MQGLPAPDIAIGGLLLSIEHPGDKQSKINYILRELYI